MSSDDDVDILEVALQLCVRYACTRYICAKLKCSSYSKTSFDINMVIVELFFTTFCYAPVKAGPYPQMVANDFVVLLFKSSSAVAYFGCSVTKENRFCFTSQF